MKVIKNKLYKGKVSSFLTTNNFAIIISSPSGAGKTTITKKLLSLFKNSYLSISCTTRDMRKGEIDAKDYFFLTKKKFKKFKEKKKFIEYAKVHKNFYGTLKSEVFKSFKKKKIVFFDVDWQGARVLRNKLEGFCFSIFLLPPTIATLRKRLMKRHKDNPKIALERLNYAKEDIKHYNEYDYLVINDNLNKCISVLSKKINEILRDKKIVSNSSVVAQRMLRFK